MGRMLMSGKGCQVKTWECGPLDATLVLDADKYFSRYDHLGNVQRAMKNNNAVMEPCDDAPRERQTQTTNGFTGF